jgi:flagellar protein FliO/FliZ
MGGPGALAALSTAHGLLAADPATTTTAPDISIGHVLLQMVVALLIVVGGIWGFSKIMRRGGRFGGPAGRSRHKTPVPGLTVLSRQTVGKGKSIAVVQAGSRRFLVGISESGLNPLGELEPGDDGPVPAGGDLRPTTAAAGTAGAFGAGGAVGIAGAAATWLDSLREATVRR